MICNKIKAIIEVKKYILLVAINLILKKKMFMMYMGRGRELSSYKVNLKQYVK